MKRISLLIAIIVCLSIALPACSTSKPTETQTTPPAPSATDAAPSPTIELVKQPEFAQRLSLAFGLFSIGVPEGSEVKNNRNIMSQERYDITNPDIWVASNFAPLDSYEETAKIKYDSIVSYYFAILPPEDYTETRYKEETLENGVKIGWQLMKGGASGRCVIFEAFSEKYGYNFAILSKDREVTDEILIDMMYSFQYNEAVENNIINLKHTKNNDGTFISVDNSLKISLNTEWNEATPILAPGIVFGLEWNNAETLIEFYRYDQIDAADQTNTFNAIIDQIKSNNPDSKWGEMKTIKLNGMGDINAYMIESEDDNNGNPVISQAVCFMHEGYFYFGSFMWLKSLDDTKRSDMEAAIQSMAPNI